MTVTIAEKLAYVASRHEEDQSKLLARAFDTGVNTLYREALVEAYLAGQCPRQDLVRELGPEAVAAVDARKKSILGDFKWGVLPASGPEATRGTKATSPRQIFAAATVGRPNKHGLTGHVPIRAEEQKDNPPLPGLGEGMRG